MIQTTIFDLPARRSDPASSKAAALHVVVSGIAGRQQNEIHAALAKHGPATSLELSQASGICRFVCARRLPELERQNRVIRGAVRECRVGRRSAIEWRTE